MVPTKELERYESCARRGTSSCPFLKKMKTGKLVDPLKADATIKLNDIMEDAAYCAGCGSYISK